MLLRVLTLLMVTLLLSSCSYIPWFGDDEEVEIEPREPSELTEITPEVRIQENWQTSLGGNAEEQFIQLQPHIYQDKIAFAQTGGKISVFQVATGRPIVSTNVGDQIFAGVGDNDHCLVLGTRDGVVRGLKSEDGVEAWSVSVSSEVSAVAHTQSELAVVRTNDDRIFGLSINTGEKLWSVTQTPPALTLRGASLPVVRDGVIYTGLDNGKVVAISADSGNAIWEARVSVPSGRSELERIVDIDGQLAIDESYVYAASYHGRVVALDKTNGRIRWARDLASISGVAIDDAQVYVTDKDDNVWALEKETGVSVWKQNQLLYRQLSAPVVQEDVVLVGDYEGYLHALSKQDGRLIGRTRVGNKPIHTSPMSTKSTAYVMDAGGHLGSYSIASGK